MVILIRRGVSGQCCCCKTVVKARMMTPLPPPVTEIRIFNVTSIYM